MVLQDLGDQYALGAWDERLRVSNPYSAVNQEITCWIILGPVSIIYFDSL